MRPTRLATTNGISGLPTGSSSAARRSTIRGRSWSGSGRPAASSSSAPEDGALALTAEGRWIEVPVVPVERVVDTNGAGDAFLAGVVFGELRGLPIERSLTLAARVAAAAVQSPELAPDAIDAEALLGDLVTAI